MTWMDNRRSQNQKKSSIALDVFFTGKKDIIWISLYNSPISNRFFNASRTTKFCFIYRVI